MKLTENEFHLLLELFIQTQDGLMEGDFENIEFCFYSYRPNKYGDSQMFIAHPDHPAMVCYFNERREPTIEEVEWVEGTEAKKEV